MKIAIAHPHPVPFALGGAENLIWGLQRNIVELSGHSCDVVSTLSPENSFWNIVESYRAFAGKDLSAYDLVISGKYPAWMVQHPNHVCYLLHRLRGLYDTYPLLSPQQRQSNGAPPVVDLMSWMRRARSEGLGPRQRDELFTRLQSMRDLLDDAATAFPGPLARAVVHFLDDCALNAQQIRRFATLSRTVQDRPGYFPHGAHVDVLYPPPHRDDYFCAGDDYLFTSSRLDRPKRIDLVIEAMRHVEADISLKIAGTGPDEARLRALAAGDERIEFLGFVGDDEIPALYANALAVPFVPVLEDYGLITLEAMRSGKPVVTVTDAGGPCELVHDGQTGFIVPPTAADLGNRLQYLCDHRAEARAMGVAGRAAVEHINWRSLVDGLIGPTSPRRHPAAPERRKITVATTFPVWPPRGGGQARVFHLYRNLARHFDVEIVSVAAPDQPDFDAEIAPGLREMRIAKSGDHEQGERTYRASVGEIALTDVSMPSLSWLTPRYRETLRASIASSFAIVACHPYLLDEIRNAARDKPLWYEAQDVEYTLKQVLLADRGPMAERLLADVQRIERECWREADFVFTCADRDLEQLQRLYGPTRARLDVVPNGVPLEDTIFVPLSERRQRQAAVGLPPRQTALFMGSWHAPNIESIHHILAYARQVPEVSFVVIGSAGRAIREQDAAVPENVRILDEVEAELREELLATADVALNPTFSGSGTNVKMLDYFAAGIPVISTPFGTRGIAASDNVHLALAEDAEFPERLRALLATDDATLSEMVTNARALVQQHYSWTAIADRLLCTLQQHWPETRTTSASGG